MEKIKVSVVMSIYNEELTEIKDSIESILVQTFREFEFIIVVDNPLRNNIIDLIKKYMQADSRIKMIVNTQNLGLANSLNKGLKIARGEYIARMDADDISLNSRLAKQVEYLDKNLDIDLIGTQGIKINETKEKVGYFKVPVKYSEIKETLKSKNCFIHPSLMFRASILEKIKGYRNFPCAQDYDFILRIEENNFKICNLEENLIKYKVRKNSITEEKRLYQLLLAQYIQELKKERLKKSKDTFNLEKIKEIEKVYLKDKVEFNKLNRLLQNHKEKKLFLIIIIPYIYIKSKHYRKEINNRMKVFLEKYLRK